MKRPRRQTSKRSSPHRSSRAAPTAPEPRHWPHPAVVALVLVSFAALFGALSVASFTRTSATWDEPGHLAAGYAALTARDYRPAIEHPPVLRLWSALPLLFLSDVSFDRTAVDRRKPEEIAFVGPFELGHRFLYRQNDGDRLLYRARFMTTILGIGLGLVLFFWVGEWLGFRAGVIALGLYTLEPNIAAHASLVTTDFGVTLFIFATMYFTWRISRRLSAWNIAGLAVCFALAVLSKFSALVLAPLMLILMLMMARRESLTFANVATIVGVSIAATFAAAWAVYGFQYSPSGSKDWLFALHDHPAARQAVPIWSGVVDAIDSGRLLPNALTQGFLHGQGLVQGRPAFLFGDYSNDGWWYYFPVAFLLKTPIALVLLFIGGLWVSIKKRRLVSLDGEAFIVLPIGVFLLAAMAASLNIGVRHILPIYPFVIVLAVIAAESLIKGTRLTGASKRVPIAFAIIMAMAAAEFARAYPNNLAFFNVLAGGPRNGFRYLADSNVDWGQDLKPLRAWMAANNVPHINLAYFGTADPNHYGMNATYLWGTTIPGVPAAALGPPRLPGYVAVSVTLLNGVPFAPAQRDFYKPLRDREPSAIIGGSIRVYWVEKPWW